MKLNTGLFFNSLLYTSYTYSSKHRRVTLQITAAFCPRRCRRSQTAPRTGQNIIMIICFSRVYCTNVTKRKAELLLIIQCTKCVKFSKRSEHFHDTILYFFFILSHHFFFFFFTDVSAVRRCNFRGLPRRGLSFPHYRGIHVILQRQGLAKTEDGP